MTIVCTIESPMRRDHFCEAELTVSTGSMHTWIPAPTLVLAGIAPEKTVRFVDAGGRHCARMVGFGIIRVDSCITADEIVFAEAGDVPALGWRALTGLNLMVDPTTNELVPAGPRPAMMASA